MHNISKTLFVLSVVCNFASQVILANDTTTMTFRVTGLFDAERPKDFQQLIATLPNIELMQLNYETTEATFRFDLKTAFPGIKSEQVLTHLDQKVRTASNSTFGIKAVCRVPREQLEKVEIAVVGLDCKACSLAAYEIVMKIEGVEQATASFKTGNIVVIFDKQKTNRQKIEDILKMRNITLK